MDVEPTPAHRTAEVNATKTMIDRVEERFAMKPKRLIGDTAYGTAEFLGENVVEPVIKLNGYLAGMQRMLELFGVKKK